MNYYFVDYENVHADGLNGLENVAAGSMMYILYSENCKNITLDIIEKAGNNSVQMYACKATTSGKNSLDFQLSSLLGYVIGTTDETEAEYWIVSKDTGFDATVDFWKRKGKKILRVNDMKGSAGKETDKVSQPVKEKAKKKAATEITQTTKKEVLKYLSAEEYSDDILKIINSYKTRTAINNGLSKLYKDSKKSGAIYKKLKQLFKEKNKT